MSTAISPAIAVTLQDAWGNTVTNSGTQIILDIGSGSSGAKLNGGGTGAITVTTVNGVATFPGGTVNKTGNFTLTA